MKTIDYKKLGITNENYKSINPYQRYVLSQERHKFSEEQTKCRNQIVK